MTRLSPAPANSATFLALRISNRMAAFGGDGGLQFGCLGGVDDSKDRLTLNAM